VNAKFEEHNFPMDVMWLDIEHTNEKRYFTWDPTNFPNPTKMIDEMSSFGRKMVTIVDPHMKRDGGYSLLLYLILSYPYYYTSFYSSSFIISLFCFIGLLIVLLSY
jgi:alpha-glucosidase (family GH31 glycosyl hydrolase)